MIRKILILKESGRIRQWSTLYKNDNAARSVWMRRLVYMCSRRVWRHHIDVDASSVNEPLNSSYTGRKTDGVIMTLSHSVWMHLYSSSFDKIIAFHSFSLVSYWICITVIHHMCLDFTYVLLCATYFCM